MNNTANQTSIDSIPDRAELLAEQLRAPITRFDLFEMFTSEFMKSIEEEDKYLNFYHAFEVGANDFMLVQEPSYTLSNTASLKVYISPTEKKADVIRVLLKLTKFVSDNWQDAKQKSLDNDTTETDNIPF